MVLFFGGGDNERIKEKTKSVVFFSLLLHFSTSPPAVLLHHFSCITFLHNQQITLKLRTLFVLTQVSTHTFQIVYVHHYTTC